MDVRASIAELTSQQGSRPEPERFDDLLTLMWEWSMHESPESATQVGHPGHDHRWTDNSLAAHAERKALAAVWLDAARGVDRAALDEPARLNLDLFLRHVQMGAASARFDDHLTPVGPVFGPQTMVAQIMAVMSAATDPGREAILARLQSLPTYLQQVQALLVEGIAQGITMPRAIMDGVPPQIQAQVVDDPLKSPLLQPFYAAGIGVDHPDFTRASTIIAEQVVPAFASLCAYVTDTYLPACRDTIGLNALPDGEEWYAHRVRYFTTTDLSPKEIHRIGLDECARIKAAMERVVEAAGFDGTREDYIRYLNEDERFYFSDDDALLATYRDICKRIDPTLPRLFGTLPRLPYGVEPVPPYMAERAPTAFYRPGAAEMGRAGTFFANTFNLRSRPSWEMEALTLHEAVPGHHLQIALAQEMPDVPEFRKHGGFTAYIEGWGLYAEHLGDELGFYADPPSRFGQLSYEMWRAGRLVVDTGMHALGWERQRAIDFLIEHTGKTTHDIEVEVDRYISWPGQALAYKIGELKIKELRARATERLGSSFDVRAFHDEILREGALPLDLLEQRVDAWIAAR